MNQITCPNCSALNEAADAFCGSCGGAIRQSPQAANQGPVGYTQPHSSYSAPGYATSQEPSTPYPATQYQGAQYQEAQYQGNAVEYGGMETGLVRVGFGPRLLAWLIDAVILYLFNLISDAGSMSWIVSAIYFIALWGSMGQTIGKMALGQTVVSVDGQPLTWGKTVLRYVGYLASALLLGIGFLMIAFGQEKQGLHDRIAGTIVVKKA